VRYDGIDRITPTRRPDATPLLHQNWHHLLFLHWEVPVNVLRPLVPEGLELDLYDGKAYVGLIPFTISGVRPILMPPLPYLSNFHEVNVRTYVHLAGTDPGVWFFSLDASSTIAVAAARAAYKLPYYPASIEFSVEDLVPPRFRFHSTRQSDPGPASCNVEYEPGGTPSAAEPGTLEHFLVERYILYAESDGRLYRARVHHAPYPLQTANILRLDDTTVWAAGIRHQEPPKLLHYASEVKVEVFPLEKLPSSTPPQAPSQSRI